MRRHPGLHAELELTRKLACGSDILACIPQTLHFVPAASHGVLMVLLGSHPPPLPSAGVERTIREPCREVKRSAWERPRIVRGTQVPAERAEALGRPLLGTFLGRTRKVPRLAGRNPPVFCPSSKSRGCAPNSLPPAAVPCTACRV